MIKLSNNEALSIVSKKAISLFNDDDRPFPVKDMFKILDIVKMIEVRVKLYYEQLDKINKKNNGAVGNSGIMDYKTDTDRENAAKEITELLETELEYNFEPLEIKDDWPKLSLTEAYILKPLIKE